MRAPEITPQTYRISVQKMIGLIATALIPAGVLALVQLGVARTAAGKRRAHTIVATTS